MKTLTFFIAAILMIGLASCNKTENIVGSEDLTELFESSDSGKNNTDLLPPVITSLNGTFGFNTSFPSNSFGSYYKADMNGSSSITIIGSNFGSVQGNSTIQLEKNSNNVWSAATNYTLTVTLWQSNKIIVKIATNTNSIPISTARFKLTVANQITTRVLSVVPYLHSRQYEQCTWWVTKRTVENGLPYTNASYSNVNSSINANYVPTAKDILSWGTDVHQAFIESVNVSSEAGNITKYVLTITEANVAYSGNGYSTSPKTYITTVKVKNTNGTKTFVSGFNKYRSTLTNGALYYKAQ